jgi:hypothetical protein
MEARARFLIGYARRHGPVSARGLYYQAEVAKVSGIDKQETSYRKVQRQVLLLRRDGRLPYRHIADATRWMRKPTSYDSVEHALRDLGESYRKNLWKDAEDYVEIWMGKDTLSGVVYPVTAESDVPLMPTRGYTSETFAFEAVMARDDDPRDYHVYYFDDLDRSGVDAAQSLKEKLERFSRELPACRCRVIFHHVAIYGGAGPRVGVADPAAQAHHRCRSALAARVCLRARRHAAGHIAGTGARMHRAASAAPSA